MAADDDQKDFTRDVRRLRTRYAKISHAGGGLADGLRKISDGLGDLLDNLDSETFTHQTRFDVILRGLSSLADLIEEDSGRGPAANETMQGASNLDQFRETFRAEARKRLSGLSISMMGIFSEDGSQAALEQTADHLHAIKGSASMLGLQQLAELIRSMEIVVEDMQAVGAEERVWPTGALLRGFHLLESAIADEELQLDESAAAAVNQQLRRSSQSVSGEHESVGAGAAASESTSASQKSGILQKRILIVDDVETIAASVGFILSELDVPIDVATNGEEAWDMLQRGGYSLVISDVDMPRLDGIALTKMIRKDDRLADIPVILLTSLDRPDERDAGMKAGASDYIIKGAIGGGELRDRVHELLEIAPRVRVPDAHFGSTEQRVLIVEDTETVAASIALVLSEGPFDIDIVRNGQKAFERLRREPYDIVLSDVQMPGMDGFELLEAIRADDALGDMPVILLTSLESKDIQDRALNSGANRFLIKGRVGGDRLLEIVREVSTEAASQEQS
ncbi:MAG: response regulator [Myxococcota bacterium]